MYDISLDSEEGLRRFQTGNLSETDQEWYRLVPPEAREALGKEEVQRQSVLFELIKSEREYVFDLEAVQEVDVDKILVSSVSNSSTGFYQTFAKRFPTHHH